MVLKELIFNSLYLLWEGVVFLKELIFNISTLVDQSTQVT